MVRVLNDLMKEGDIIGHLHYFDIVLLVTLGEKNKFYDEKNMLIDAFNNGKMFIAQYFAVHL